MWQEFDTLDPASASSVFVGFPRDNHGSHMTYEADRDPSIAPSLAEMTRKAITLLSKHERFFLQVRSWHDAYIHITQDAGH